MVDGDDGVVRDSQPATPRMRPMRAVAAKVLFVMAFSLLD
jgi:hypothetical protein